MFIKKIFGNATVAEIDRSFWQNFEAKVKPFSCEKVGATPKPVFDTAFVLFGEKKGESFVYEMILQSMNPKDDPYVFPLEENLKPTYEVEKEKVIFTFALQGELHLMIEFPIKNENYDIPAHFREILGKLLFQKVNKKPIKDAQDAQKEVAFFVKPKAEQVIEKPKVKTEFGESIQKLQTMNEILLAGVGRFTSLDPQNKEELPVVIYESAIFAVAKKGAFASEFQVMNEKLDVQYRKEIDEGLYFYTDTNRNCLTWVDMKNGKVICLNFTLFEGEVHRIKATINACILQRQNKQEIEDLAKEKPDWEKYYASEVQATDEDTDRIKGFTKNRTEIKINEEVAPIYKKQKEVVDDDKDVKEIKDDKTDSDPLKLGKINTFTQGKNNEAIFVGREKGLEVYRFKRSDGDLVGIESVGSLPEKVAPRNLISVEKDTKLISLDANNDKLISYIDPEKGKIIAEWTPAEKIHDITFAQGKFQASSDSPNFFAIGDRDILNIDPRTKNGVVDIKNYKSDYGFQKVIGAGNDHFVVGSNNGDIRMYQKLGENAKNLVPSLIQSEVIGLDSSKDGSLLLVVHSTHLLLIPTFQGAKSAFEFTFKKEEKPSPRVLKIDPQAMAKNGISKINFTSAHFDEKVNSEESYIIATTGEYMVLWSLARVLRGQLVTSNLKKMDKQLVASQFKFDSNDLVAAFEDQLFIQPTKERTA